MTLFLDFVTPQKRVTSKLEVIHVVVPAVLGEVMILPGHTLFLGALGKGRLLFKDIQQQEHRYEISGGFVEVREEGKVSILAE